MGLITKEVEVKLNGSNIKHFENLGYAIPRRNDGNGRISVRKGTTIIVKTSDLKPNSHCSVEVECDCCGKTFNVRYVDYTTYNHKGNYYCTHCAKSIFISGENHPCWNPNKTNEERIQGRHYPEYIEFVKKVLARDKYTCQCCGYTNDNSMDVHHLNGYNWFIDGRTDETNAVALCKNCHGNFHSLYGKGHNTKEQYEEWIGYAIGELEKYNGKLTTARKVFDYERNEVYDSANQYANIFNVDVTSVRRCCNHDVRLLKAKLKDGTEVIHKKRYNTVKGHHLFWLHEYENMTYEEVSNIVNKQNKILIRNQESLTNGSFIMQ